MTEPARAYRLRHANRLGSSLARDAGCDLFPEAPLDRKRGLEALLTEEL